MSGLRRTIRRAGAAPALRTSWLLGVALAVAVLGPCWESRTATAAAVDHPSLAGTLGELDGVAATPSGVLAVGTFSRYFTSPPCGQVFTTASSGAGWRTQYTGGAVNHLCAWRTAVTADSRGGAWAVGYYIDSAGMIQNLVERYSGGSWSIVPSPHPGRQSVLDAIAVGPNHQIWAVGQYQAKASGIRIGALKTLTMLNVGSGWRVVRSPNPGGSNNSILFGVTASSSGRIWAVGYFVDTQNVEIPRRTLTMVYQAGNWQIVPSPSPGSTAQSRGSQLYSVTPGPHGGVWAVGYYLDSNMHTRTLAMFNGGSGWSVVPSPSPGRGDAELRAVVTTSAGAVWAAGSFTGRRCTRTLTLRYTGAAWQNLHAPNPTCSATHPNALYGLAADRAGTVYAVGATDIDTLLLVNRGSGWQVAVK